MHQDRAQPGRGVLAQLSNRRPNHADYLFGFSQSISCSVPEGRSEVKGAGRKGLPEAGARTRKRGKLGAQAEEASLSEVGRRLTGLTEKRLGDSGCWKGVEEQARRMVSPPWGWASGLWPPRKQTSLFPGGLQAATRVLCGLIASFLTRGQRQQHAAAGATRSVALNAPSSADAFANLIKPVCFPDGLVLLLPTDPRVGSGKTLVFRIEFIEI